ncbi:uncharacterized protein LOC119328159 [Triticum dicoccoides]|uniref:uncharacterized protein LOC119328159 n=1 Tax=Triticum dicoccoides TaxID=85692 RepID=UPI000E79BA00|nr:uncharacterized protein LOC119328159 [Triticum dicoccoides]XP_044428483.1 uncharacterized protein LOC123153412 [Triticum aestivum]
MHPWPVQIINHHVRCHLPVKLQERSHMAETSAGILIWQTRQVATTIWMNRGMIFTMKHKVCQTESIYLTIQATIDEAQDGENVENHISLAKMLEVNQEVSTAKSNSNMRTP